jgi:RHS repeat-associated protein
MCADLVTTLLLASDTRNTVLAAIDPAGVNASAYTPYGAQSAKGVVQNSLGFNGQLRERPTGWYHLGNGHRVYNPVLMRFHTPDKLSPFGKGGLNSYAYCVGDPVNLVDPTGQLPEWLQPVPTIALNVLTFAATAAAAVVAPPVGIGLHAVRLSLIGSPVAVVGATLQLAGVEEGKYLSATGTGISALGVATRGGMSVHSLATDPDWRRKLFRNVRSLVGIPPRSERATVPASGPVRPSIVDRANDVNIPGYLAAVARYQGKAQPDLASLGKPSPIEHMRKSVMDQKWIRTSRVPPNIRR